MHYHMQNEQYRQVVEVCELYGDQEACLWEQALGYFAHKEEDCKEYVAAVLKHIETKNLMPPLLGEKGGCGPGGWHPFVNFPGPNGALQPSRQHLPPGLGQEAMAFRNRLGCARCQRLPAQASLCSQGQAWCSAASAVPFGGGAGTQVQGKQLEVCCSTRPFLAEV